MIPNELMIDLITLKQKLAQQEWMVVVSLAAALQGVDVEVGDIDIFSADIHQTHLLLKQYASCEPEPVILYYNKQPYNFIGAAYQLGTTTVDALEPPSPFVIDDILIGFESKIMIDKDGLAVPVLPLQLVLHMYNNMPREQDRLRAKLIETFMQG